MYCQNCGKKNEPGKFCVYCGAVLEELPFYSQPGMQQPQGQSAQTSSPIHTSRKKAKALIIIGIAAAVLIGTAAALFFTLTYSIEGQWLNKDRGEVLSFGTDGKVAAVSFFGVQNNRAAYNRLTGEGTITVNSVSHKFKADQHTIAIDDLGTFEKADSQFDRDAFLNQYGKLDTWYSEDRGDILTFSPGAVLQHIRLNSSSKTSYDYDYTTGSGSLMLGQTSYNFTVKNGYLDISELGEYLPAGSGFESDAFIGQYGQLGTWYNETRGEVIVFNQDNKLLSRRSYGDTSATYEYSREDNAVKMTLGPFSYDGQIKDGQLVVKDLGTYILADDSFDAASFINESGESILGIWYDASGELTIDLHDDGTYDAVSYGVSFEGTCVLRDNGVNIDYVYFDESFPEDYSLVNGELVKPEPRINGAADKLVRGDITQKGREERYTVVLGKWLSDDGLIILDFINENEVIFESGDPVTFPYKYDPLGDVGFLYFFGDPLLFVSNGDNLLLGAFTFSRIQ